MLPKRYRLPMHSRLVPTISIQNSLFNLKVRPNELAYSRFAFVISKKVDPRATARNVTKRRYRDCIQNHMNEITPGYDMLFILRKALAKEEGDALCAEVLRELRKKSLVHN